jgi:hypothetical protein
MHKLKMGLAILATSTAVFIPAGSASADFIDVDAPPFRRVGQLQQAGLKGPQALIRFEGERGAAVTPLRVRAFYASTSGRSGVSYVGSVVGCLLALRFPPRPASWTACCSLTDCAPGEL